MNIKEVLQEAQKGKYAIPAFNVENMEMFQAVLEGANELKSPVILQTTPSTLKYSSPFYFSGLYESAKRHYLIPIFIHLDHGDSYELVEECINSGYNSLMYDGSKQEYAINVIETKKVVDLASKHNLYVEGEIGQIGGKEDTLVVKETRYTDPKEAKRFAKETGVSSLAVAIGTVHGVYKEAPCLNFDILSKIREEVELPLVLHGTSGVSDEDVKRAISLGICKVNYATDLRIAFSNGVKSYLSEDKEVIDPKKYLKVARSNVKDYVKEKIMVCGSNYKA